MSKVITLNRLSDFLTNLKGLFVTKTDAESTYATKEELNSAKTTADDTYETKTDAATHLTKIDAETTYATKTELTTAENNASNTYLSKTDAKATYATKAENNTKANNSEVVHKSGDETIAGTKTFSSQIKGNISGSSTSCTGNSASATKATQDSDGNTITTTYLSKTDAADTYATKEELNSASPSAIRAQWYAAYPDGPEAHNAMWGGRDITAAFDNGTVSANIANGSFRDIFPGDYITKSVTISGKTYTVNWVIADCDYWWHKGDQNNGMETHHVVIVPQAAIFEENMNASNATDRSYKGSRMYGETIPACATGIVSAFGSGHILTFRDGISNSVDTSHVSSGIPQWTGTPGWWGEWVSVQCNLMSEKMVYGAPICAAGAMDNSVATRQMSAFRLSERLINYDRQGYWLRDVVSSKYFAVVSGYGTASAWLLGGSYVSGVRPFALLK